jgi:hypothetical protein
VSIKPCEEAEKGPKYLSAGICTLRLLPVPAIVPTRFVLESRNERLAPPAIEADSTYMVGACPHAHQFTVEVVRIFSSTFPWRGIMMYSIHLPCHCACPAPVVMHRDRQNIGVEENCWKLAYDWELVVTLSQSQRTNDANGRRPMQEGPRLRVF